jgi:hypothetical protein
VVIPRHPGPPRGLPLRGTRRQSSAQPLAGGPSRRDRIPFALVRPWPSSRTRPRPAPLSTLACASRHRRRRPWGGVACLECCEETQRRGTLIYAVSVSFSSFALVPPQAAENLRGKTGDASSSEGR